MELEYHIIITHTYIYILVGGLEHFLFKLCGPTPCQLGELRKPSVGWA